MNRAESSSVAVLVATADRPGLLVSRALPSIGQQTLAPARVLVVDDSRDGEASRPTVRAMRSWRRPGVDVALLCNRRTKGAPGAWNTGLDRLLRTCGDPTRVYVAILDDDDRWEPGHLESCLALAGQRNLDLVAAPFLRIEEGEEPKTIFPPKGLDAADFLTGNPGIQASNLVCRLSVLLEAGLFDEALSSCTDRDLCIRIADLPGVRYGTTSHPTVRHYACRSRPRLSTPGSASRLTGLDGFFGKYRGRMNDSERARFRTRARALFGWREAPTGSVESCPVQDTSDTRQHGGAPGEPVHLIVGTVADSGRLEDLGGLLADLREAGRGSRTCPDWTCWCWRTASCPDPAAGCGRLSSANALRACEFIRSIARVGRKAPARCCRSRRRGRNCKPIFTFSPAGGPERWSGSSTTTCASIR